MKNIPEEKFIQFFEEHHPEMLKYDPKLIEIIGNIVVFEMKNHSGQFCVNINN